MSMAYQSLYNLAEATSRVASIGVVQGYQKTDYFACLLFLGEILPDFVLDLKGGDKQEENIFSLITFSF